MSLLRFKLIVFVGGIFLLANNGLGDPRKAILFDDARIAAFKNRLAKEPSTATAWSNLLARATKAAEAPAMAASNVDDLALAFAMTRDGKYSMALERFLDAEARRSNWGEKELLQRDPPWHGGLGTARDCVATAMAFDAIHDVLSPDDRRRYAQAIATLGIQPALDDWLLGKSRIHSLDTMGHNWWSACVFSAGLAALAVRDEVPQSSMWLHRIDAAASEWFNYSGSLLENKPATFDPAGGYYESVNYGAFALSEYLQFRLAWTNVFGKPPADIPMLSRISRFFLAVSYPNSGTMMTLEFGDGSLHADGSRPLCLLWANGIRDPDILWYLKGAQTMSYKEGLDPSTALGLIYFPSPAELDQAPREPGQPPSALFGEMGWAMLRSSWHNDATLLGVKAGYTWNHSHADEGSFVLFHRGSYLLIDSGNCSYDRPEYDGYYRQSRAHNVVLFNGQAENPENTYYGSKFSGSVSQLFDVPGLKYVLADATGPTSQVFARNYRHFLWVGDVILVIDDVEAFTPGQFEWLLHVGAPARRLGLDLAVGDDRSRVLVRPLFPSTFPDGGLPTDFPEKMRLKEETGLADHDPDKKVAYYSFVPTEIQRRTKFVTAILLETDENRKSLPRVSRFEGSDLEGVEIRDSGKVTDVYLNLLADNRIRHRNANNRLGDWDTDAYLLAVTHSESDPQGDERFFVADGSYLRDRDRVALDSLSKVYASWTESSERFDLTVHGQIGATVRLQPRGKVGSLLVNGAPQALVTDGGVIRTEIPNE